MLGLGTILSSAAGIGASIFGSKKSAQQSKKAERKLDEYNRKSEGAYLNTANQDATQLADFQSALAYGRDNYRMLNDQIAGESAVMGGTKRVQDTKDLSNIIAQGAAAGVARGDAALDSYLRRAESISKNYQDMYNTRANNIMAAARGVGNAAGDVATADAASLYNTGKGLFGNWFKRKEAQP